MFSSTSSKNKAEATVNKLLGDLLPNVAEQDKSKKTEADLPKKSKTQILSNQFDLTVDPINTKKHKAKRNLQIKKFNESNKKFQKLTKYTLIKQSTNKSLNHEKYLQKLVNRNINSINKYDIENEETKQQLDDLKLSLLPKLSSSKSRLRKKLLLTTSNDNQQQFNEKVKKGWISMPGLTPGLAPVDYNEDSD